MAEIKRWTILRNSGAAETLWGPAAKNTGNAVYPYLSVLEWIYRDQSAGGSMYDTPNMLFADGKLVMEGNLTDAAHEYVTNKRAAMDKLSRQIDADYDKDFSE